MDTATPVENIAVQVADLLLSYRDKTSGLLLTGQRDAFTGTWIKEESDPDDIGDTLIFVAWLGVLLGKRHYLAAVKEMVETTCGHLQDDYGFFHVWNFSHGTIPRKKYPIRTSFQLDILLGLNRLYILTKDIFYLDHAAKLANALNTFTQSKYGYFFDMVHPPLRVALPHKLVKASANGTIAEELLILAELSGENTFKTAALRALDYWSNTPAFRSTGLFSGGDMPYLNIMIKPLSFMVKNNSNMLFGLLEGYRQTHDEKYLEAVMRGLGAIAKLQTDAGGFPKAFNIKRKEVSIPEVELDQNFNILDIFLELSRIKNSSYLSTITKKGFDFWTSLQDTKTGLMAEGPPGQNVEITVELPSHNRNGRISNICKIDQASDLCVEFCKYAELTGDYGFIKRAVRLLEAIWKYHKFPYGIAQVTNSQNGAVIESKNITKYVGGYLKGLLSALVLLKGKSLLNDKVNWRMTMDR